ncbi:MAG: phosphodiesterase [Anaerolineae bacterium]
MLRFIHVSDTHIRLTPNPAWQPSPLQPTETLMQIIRAIQALPFQPDFILHTGDVCDNDASEAEYLWVVDRISEIPIPTYFLVGNHDNRRLLKQAIGMNDDDAPHDFVFTCGEIVVIAMDTQDRSLPHPRGGLSAEQLVWLQHQLAVTSPARVIVALHHHVLAVGIPALDTAALVNGERLHDLLRHVSTRIAGVFCGHIHQHMHVQREGLLYSAAPGAYFQYQALPGDANARLDPYPTFGFSVVTVTQHQTFVRPIYFDAHNGTNR